MVHLSTNKVYKKQKLNDNIVILFNALRIHTNHHNNNINKKQRQRGSLDKHQKRDSKHEEAKEKKHQT